MSLPEMPASLKKGEPQVIVDEILGDNNKSYLYCACFDENGEVTYVTYFNRNASPEEISRVLKEGADVYMGYHPNTLSNEEAYIRAEEWKELAKTIPGLEVKDKKVDDL